MFAIGIDYTKEKCIASVLENGSAKSLGIFDSLTAAREAANKILGTSDSMTLCIGVPVNMPLAELDDLLKSDEWLNCFSTPQLLSRSTALVLTDYLVDSNKAGNVVGCIYDGKTFEWTCMSIDDGVYECKAKRSFPVAQIYEALKEIKCVDGFDDIKEVLLVADGADASAVEGFICQTLGVPVRKVPVESIAYGCAVQSAVMMGEQTVRNLLLLDSFPCSIDVLGHDGAKIPVISDSTILPTKQTITVPISAFDENVLTLRNYKKVGIPKDFVTKLNDVILMFEFGTIYPKISVKVKAGAEKNVKEETAAFNEKATSDFSPKTQKQTSTDVAIKESEIREDLEQVVTHETSDEKIISLVFSLMAKRLTNVYGLPSFENRMFVNGYMETFPEKNPNSRDVVSFSQGIADTGFWIYGQRIIYKGLLNALRGKCLKVFFNSTGSTKSSMTSGFIISDNDDKNGDSYIPGYEGHYIFHFSNASSGFVPLEEYSDISEEQIKKISGIYGAENFKLSLKMIFETIKRRDQKKIDYAVQRSSDYFEKIDSRFKYGTFTDERDGQTYRTIQIGNQIWMAECLRYKTEGGNADGGKGSFVYENNPQIGKRFGRMYTWAAAMDLPSKFNRQELPIMTKKRISEGNFQGIAPDGWHIPSRAEMQEMLDYVEENSDFSVRRALCASLDGSFEKDSFGFALLEGGSYNEGFSNLLKRGSLWISAENGDYDAFALEYGDLSGCEIKKTVSKTQGNYIRCIKNLSDNDLQRVRDLDAELSQLDKEKAEANARRKHEEEMERIAEEDAEARREHERKMERQAESDAEARRKHEREMKAQAERAEREASAERERNARDAAARARASAESERQAAMEAKRAYQDSIRCKYCSCILDGHFGRAGGFCSISPTKKHVLR